MRGYRFYDKSNIESLPNHPWRHYKWCCKPHHVTSPYIFVGFRVHLRLRQMLLARAQQRKCHEIFKAIRLQVLTEFRKLGDLMAFRWPFDGLDGPWLAWHTWHHRVVVSTAASGPTRPSSEALNSAGGPYSECCQNLPVSQKDAESLHRLSRYIQIIHDYRALNIFDKVNVPRCHHWHCWTCHFHEFSVDCSTLLDLVGV